MNWFCKKKEEIKLATWCVPSAIFCATVFAIKQKCEVRIAVFNLRPGVDHVQAQALIDGKWVYLTEYWNGQSMAVKTYGKNHPDAKEPYRYVGLLDFLEEQKEVLNLKI